MSTQPVTALKGQPIIDETCTAAAAISPGHLIELASATTVQKHSTAAGNAAKCFALERSEMGKSVTDAYATSDRVKMGMFRPGDRVQARLAAAAAAVVAGAYLESAGNGTLRVLTANAATSQAQRASVVARAREAVDNSGGGTEVFIDVEII
jgi:hypothetical protein